MSDDGEPASDVVFYYLNYSVYVTDDSLLEAAGVSPGPVIMEIADPAGRLV